MTKHLLILLGAALLTNAATAHRNIGAPAIGRAGNTDAVGHTPLTGAKATNATAFYTDTFSATSLTTGGWVAGGNTGTAGSWKFTNRASTGSYSIGKIFSTTNAGGWMLYDSDSIGVLFNNSPQIGTLTSPSISCTGHNYVGVRFQQYYRRFQDTCALQISTNGGTSWTTYYIAADTDLNNNQETENPQVTTVNVSATAANQANVKVRFYYSGVFVGGGYNWLVDDFQMLDLDQVDVAVGSTGTVMALDGSFTPIGTQPRQLIDTVRVITGVSNFGGTAQSGVTVTSSVFNNGTNVLPATVSIPSLPVNTYNLFTIFSSGYTPSATGTYTGTVSVNQASDGTVANNTDTASFNVSDSSLCVFRGYSESNKQLNPRNYEGGRYLHSSTGTSSFYQGTYFEIGTGKKDTITSISVCLDPSTTVGAQITAEIYKFDNSTSSYIVKGRTITKTLGISDISSATALTFTNLPVQLISGRVFTIADAGLWVAVVRAVSPTTAQNVVVVEATPAAPATFLGNYGVSDQTTAASGLDFGTDLLATNSTFGTAMNVPAVVVNFANNAKSLSVSGIAGIEAGTAYPNPANNQLNIPVTATAGASVTVTISNMIGQQLLLQHLGNMAAGNRKTAVFATASLPAGVYLATVSAGGERTTSRVVIAH